MVAWLMMRRIINEELERANQLSTTTNTSNPKPAPAPANPAKAPVSVLVALSLGLLALGFAFLCVGVILTALPVFLYFAGFDALAAITLAVLSLREDKN